MPVALTQIDVVWPRAIHCGTDGFIDVMAGSWQTETVAVLLSTVRAQELVTRTQ